jgi:hypothetical protein
MHGWGITERIEQWSERQGLSRAEWKVTEHNRSAGYYGLTGARRRRFSDESVQWQGMSRAVNLVLAATTTKS